uniref:Uncharacterized protein n=1 Tax=Arundo donax TaxID=35708 RepID=A0A0A8YH97_ARUDO
MKSRVREGKMKASTEAPFRSRHLRPKRSQRIPRLPRPR